MRQILTMLIAVFLGTQIMAEELSISGTVLDENGNAVQGHAVFLVSNDSVNGFFYSNTVYTNTAGVFVDIVQVGDTAQGGITASTESCDEMITITEFFNPGNLDLEFAFQICTDTTGGGNDTIVYSCENYFYFYQNGMEVSFFGGVYQEGDVTFSWDFGDGTVGEGMEVNHEYTEEGIYEVSLETILNDTCEFVSYQTIYVFQDTSAGGNDTVLNCANDFNYTVTGQSVSVDGWGLDNQVVESYSWDFGDGNTATGQTANHAFTAPGEYVITLTTITIDTCVAQTSKLVYIGDTIVGEILQGTVRKGEAFLDFGTVKLYSIESDTIGGDDDIELFGETTVDSSGMYFFQNVPLGNYLILAQADQQSVYYDQTLPTYYGDVIHWLDATVVVLGDAMNPYDINLAMSGGANSGEGQINGDVIGEGFKSQLIDEEIILILLDENNNALEFTLSELDSEFSFGDLAFGEYIVYAEVVGIPTEPGIVNLSADNPTAQIGIYINPNSVTTGIDNIGNVQISGSIYPNPVNSYAQIDLEIKQASQIELILLNQMGQVLERRSEYLNQGVNKVELNTQAYPAGVYFMQVRSEKSIINKRFIKK